MFELVQIGASEWKRNWSQDAHLVGFGEIRNPENERIDFALVALNEELPMGYITCRELDEQTLYWKFGASFPETKGTIKTLQICEGAAKWSLARYNRVQVFIENENVAMLKLALRVGFRITGIRNFDSKILVEHTLLKGAKND